tara:strand:+ start:1797 stop:1991 length:195 start_codon:yes stop_codon:yes gene_type:complete
MKPITCTPENVAQFNAALRQQPDLFEFAKALHKAGLIDGLAGARITPLASQPEPRATQNTQEAR